MATSAADAQTTRLGVGNNVPIRAGAGLGPTEMRPARRFLLNQQQVPGQWPRPLPRAPPPAAGLPRLPPSAPSPRFPPFRECRPGPMPCVLSAAFVGAAALAISGSWGQEIPRADRNRPPNSQRAAHRMAVAFHRRQALGKGHAAHYRRATNSLRCFSPPRPRGQPRIGEYARSAGRLLAAGPGISSATGGRIQLPARVSGKAGHRLVTPRGGSGRGFRCPMVPLRVRTGFAAG